MGGVVYDENEIGLQRKKCKITPLERVHNDSTQQDLQTAWTLPI